MKTDYTGKDDEQRLLNDPEYAQAWVEQEIARGTFYFYKELDLVDHYVCDCEVNYGKDCKFPIKYREGGCK